MALTQPYIVVEQKSGYSKIAGTPMTTVIMVGVKDRREYVTYVDTPNRNAVNWQHITRHADHGFVLRNLKVTDKTTKKGQSIINADSEPIIEWETDTLDEVLADAQKFWEQEDRKNGSDKFGDLFEDLF
jgi:predicted GNAT family acetyltransferase